MSEAETEPKWYAKRGEKEIGPFALDKLQDLANTGRIVAGDMVRSSKEPEWQLASKVIRFREKNGVSQPVQSPLPPSLGFFDYCWNSYARTHTALPWVFGIILGILLIATLSFSKPRLGLQSIWAWSVVTVMLAFSAFATLSVIASVNFLFRRQRQIPEGHTSWLSAMACFFFTLSMALGTCGVAETFGPNNGILVTLVPQLQKEQARMFLDAAVQQNEPNSISSENEVVLESPNVEQPSPKPTPSQNLPDSSPEIVFLNDDVEQTSNPNLQKATKPIEANPTTKTQGVISEGVGATADEAIKDAYRNAVRQVVGAVVDAETLIQNDEIIDDKVLTYSDGFIKTYEEVAGSKKVQGGLHRIKIKAQVERRSIIAKLKAANVMTKEVDGKGLFAEVVTQLDAEKDASALLMNQFKGFPQSCITATIIGKPEIVSKTNSNATVKITVQLEPDMKAYKAFADKMIPILDKLAKDTGEFTAKYRIDPNTAYNSSIDRSSEEWAKWMPKLIQMHGVPRWKDDKMSIALATSRTKAADSIDYKYYILDNALQNVLKAVSSRVGHCKLQLLDDDGGTVVTDRFEPQAEFYGSLIASGVDITGSGYAATVSQRHSDGAYEYDYRVTLLSIAPVFGNMKSQMTTVTISRSLTLNLEELKSSKNAKVEIKFDE